MPGKRGAPEVRFWRYVEKGRGKDDCWLWTGTLRGSGQPYGGIRIGGRSGRHVLAHRFSWELHNGDRLRGERNAHARLTEAAVREIRSKGAAGVRTAVLAAEYGISADCVRKVVTRRRWRHVE